MHQARGVRGLANASRLEKQVWEQFHADSEAIAAEAQQAYERLPVVALGAEHLVIGSLMRRNVLAYKAPEGNEGYDLICIHPDPRHRPKPKQRSQVRVQVKSRFATDCDRGVLVRPETVDAFDYLVAVFMNIGRFQRGRDGTEGKADVEFYTLPATFIRKHQNKGGWRKLFLRGMGAQLEPYADEVGFEQVAKDLGVPRPSRLTKG
ncbi:MAG: hypothetical protein WD118_11445 [Phycisphaeraceae bacterium]